MLGVTCVLRVICSTTNFDQTAMTALCSPLSPFQALSLSVSLSWSLSPCRGWVRAPVCEPCRVYAAVPRSLENLAAGTSICTLQSAQHVQYVAEAQNYRHICERPKRL